MAFLSKNAEQLVMDYNVTCPDNRFCKVRHRFASPCELWDCSACWWHYPNCTKTEEPPSEQCPYVTCENLPNPSSHHTVATVSAICVTVFFGLFFFFLRRRFRAWRNRAFAANADAEGEGEGEGEEEGEREEDQERLPLLARCRAFFHFNRAAAIDRFHRLIWRGERAAAAPPERLDAELADQGPLPYDDHRPSAPPPSYEDIHNDEQQGQNRPIIRNQHDSASRGLINHNYGSMDTRHVGPLRIREPRQMEEVPLLQGKGTTHGPTVTEDVSSTDPGSSDRGRLTRSQSLC